ncbi:MAG: hypothetical protein Hens2KO_09770 [Henriciella sp.]
MTQPAAALSALDEWNAAARDALPVPVKVWLGMMMLTNLAALGFVRNHVAARWVFGGFLISHVIVMVMWTQGIQVLAGQVSLFHVIFWTPGMIALVTKRAELKLTSSYAIWASCSLLFYFGSMVIDVRDAYTFVVHAV